ncbi:MAG: hypothetical protein R3B09_26290 [Nannocystaceae bacterium]
MSESPPPRRPTAQARALGLLGGLSATLMSVAVLYACVDLFLAARAGPAVLGLIVAITLGGMILSGFFAVILLALGVAAMIDATRLCRGGAAGRLWLFYAFPTALGAVAVASERTADMVGLWFAVATVTATNFLAWRAYRRDASTPA